MPLLWDVIRKCALPSERSHVRVPVMSWRLDNRSSERAIKRATDRVSGRASDLAIERTRTDYMVKSRNPLIMLTSPLDMGPQDQSFQHKHDVQILPKLWLNDLVTPRAPEVHVTRCGARSNRSSKIKNSSIHMRLNTMQRRMFFCARDALNHINNSTCLYKLFPQGR